MYMKKLFGAILATITLISCNNEGSVTIRGSYPAGAGEYLRFEMLNMAETILLDSVKVSKKGDFRYTFPLENPELVMVENKKGQYINLLAFPQDEISLTMADNSFRSGYTVSGSEDSEKIRMLVTSVEKTKSRLDSVIRALDSLEIKDGPEADVLITAYQQIFRDQKRENIRFIVENLNSLASVYALYQRVAPDVYLFNTVKDLQYFKIVADSVKVYHPNSTLTISLVNDVDKRISDYNNMIAINELTKSNVVETGMIELKIEDVDGEEQSLRALNGKVILLNFWASWNSESRDATNRLKNIYERYHDQGFEIYAVSLDNDRMAWRQAIDFEEYPWINVSELTYPYSKAATLYNVPSLPSSYLIDREGNIVAKNLTGRELPTWLDNLL